MCDTEFIAQNISYVLEQQFIPVKTPVCTKQYLIDIQRFKICSHEFIIREFSIVSCNATFIFRSNVTVQCPLSDLACGYQRQIHWLTQNLHGLTWNNTNGYNIVLIRKLLFQWCEADTVSLQWTTKKTILRNYSNSK